MHFGIHPVDFALMPYYATLAYIMTASLLLAARTAMDGPVAFLGTELHPSRLLLLPTPATANHPARVVTGCAVSLGPWVSRIRFIDAVYFFLLMGRVFN